MTDALLSTKLTIPPTRPDLVGRPRLTKALDASLSSKLILVSAPAGFGKTTLLSAWAHGSDASMGWVALDDGDNDLTRFLTYFVTALRAFSAEAGGQVLTMLQARTSPSIDRLGTALINDLAHLADDLVIILDDYHVIESRPVHDTVTFLLEHLPPQAHLVISTRSDPPLPVAKLRGGGELVELRAAELRFTPQEASEFLRSAMGVALSANVMEVLNAQIEGWAVGLQLAGLALKEQEDTRAFVEAFGGSHRYVIDYLTDEVLQRQPDEVRRFLEETSILNSLSPALCDAVTSRPDSQNVLMDIEQVGLFLVPLDDRREWYRYHHLFRDALLFRLEGQSDAQSIADLHCRAAAWYAQNDFVDEALRHWMEAGNYVEAADLIQAVGHRMLAGAQLGKLRRWIDALPDELVRQQPWLCVQSAWVHNLNGELDESEHWLQAAERAMASEDAQQAAPMRGNIATVRAGAARKQHNSEAAIHYLQEALDNLPEDDLLVRCSAHFNLGSTYLDVGDAARGEEALSAAVREAEGAGNLYTLIAGKSYLADACLLQGQLRRATDLYREAIQDGLAGNGGRPLAPSGYAYGGLGQVLYEQNELNAAESNLNQALELGERLADWTIVRRALPALACLQQIKGLPGDAEASLQWAFDLARQYGDRHGESYLEALQARLWLVRAAWNADDPFFAAASRWAEKYHAGGHPVTDYPETLAQLTLACVEMAQGDADKAVKRLGQMAEAALNGERADCLTNVLACLALAQDKLGQSGDAQASLLQAFERAAPEGYCRTFVDYGPPMRDLLRGLAVHQPLRAYLDTLVAAFPSGLQESPVVPLDEPLNERERAILRLMAAGLSNREIADELYLSVNTIKWYSSQIYGKLGVSKRAEAVARAHELGIL